MIPTRLLTVIASGVSPADAADTAEKIVEEILYTSDVTFYKTFGPGPGETSGYLGDKVYKPPAQPGPVPLFVQSEDDEPRSDVDRYFDDVTANSPQLAAFEEAMVERTDHESVHPLAGAMVTVALSKSVMRFLDAVSSSPDYSKEEFLEGEVPDEVAATEIGDPDWYLGDGNKRFHPDLPASAVAGLSSDIGTEVFDEFDAVTPHQYLYTHHHDPLEPLTSFDQIAKYLDAPAPEFNTGERWYAVPIDTAYPF